SANGFVPNAYLVRNRRKMAAFPDPVGSKALKEDFTIRVAGRWPARSRLALAVAPRRGRCGLLTRPNHLYISTKELAFGAARARLDDRAAARLRVPQKRTVVTLWRKPCSPNRSSISPISATWSC